MHEPIEDSTIQRDSSGIPQVSTEGSSQGTNQSNIWETPKPTRRANKDPLVFDINTNTIKKHKSRLIKSDSRKPSPRNDSPLTFPPDSKSYNEILESVIKDLLKINLLEREDQPLYCLIEEDIPMDNTDVASETLDSSEIIRKAKELVSLQKNPLYKQRSKMTSNGYPGNYKPPRTNGESQSKQ
eukprot:Gb_39581 [translate_table: standard]